MVSGRSRRRNLKHPQTDEELALRLAVDELHALDVRQQDRALALRLHEEHNESVSLLFVTHAPILLHPGDPQTYFASSGAGDSLARLDLLDSLRTFSQLRTPEMPRQISLLGACFQCLQTRPNTTL